VIQATDRDRLDTTGSPPIIFRTIHAAMAELADALDSGSSQPLFSPIRETPHKAIKNTELSGVFVHFLP
jgi:hypothetical protein